MQLNELERLRIEIAESYYVKHLDSTSPEEFENLARKSLEHAEVFVKVYKEMSNGSAIPTSAYVKGGES
jgi:hypothetical protein